MFEKGRREMKKIIALVLAMMMALSLVACGGGSNNDGGNAEKPSKIVMGTSADYPPFEFHILDNGQDKIVGIDVSLGEQVAKDMGAEFEVVHMDFDNLMTLMAQGNCDMVIAAMEYKDERAANADCSDPYYADLPPVIITKKGNEGQYKSLDDFAGKTVGAQMATTKADVVTNDMNGSVPQLMSSVVDLVNNLVNGKCDALVLDGAVANKYLAANPDLAAVDIDMGEAAEPYRVWVAKGDPKGLLPEINKTIANVTTDGTMESWIEQANELSAQALD